MIKKTYEITSDTGLHARPSTLLVGAVTPFKSDVKLGYNGKEVNLKSIMGVMSLGIATGSTVEVTADGEDEEQVIEKVDSVMEAEGIGRS